MGFTKTGLTNSPLSKVLVPKSLGGSLGVSPRQAPKKTKIRKAVNEGQFMSGEFMLKQLKVCFQAS